MDIPSSQPGSPGTPTPLQPVSHNQQRDSALSSLRSDGTPTRDSSVHDKINQFNSLATQSKHLERKTADAALKRAMVAREQAENEMRQYRDEARALRRHAEEGKMREQKVGERLEAVMENYARAKETHAHTQALWEKEIRRARKETFKSQSTLVKLQEELKTARAAQKSAEDVLEAERSRGKAREQEAFAARYNLVGIQEQLDQALERIKVLEQERDAFKSLAKSEEDVARIAAEGMLPLPAVGPEDDDEFASPVKKRASSVALVDVKSSATSEAEIEELTRLWQWERQRANRAWDHLDFQQAECQLRCCPCAKEKASHHAGPSASSPRRKVASPAKITDASDLAILSENAAAQPALKAAAPPKRSKTERLKGGCESKPAAIFVPSEGVFRTLSQQQAEALETNEEGDKTSSHHPSAAEMTDESEPPTPTEPQEPSMYARTPSVDPPAFAISAACRTSLLSLLDAPHQQESDAPAFNIPTMPGPPPKEPSQETETESDESGDLEPATSADDQCAILDDDEDDEADETILPPAAPATFPLENVESEEAEAEAPFPRPHTSATFYSVKTTTVKVNMESPQKPNLSARLMAMQRTPSQGSSAAENPSFDATNPALTPTMTREQALAQIRERRGRARSIAQGAVTPRKQMVRGLSGERRDVSAPTGRVAGPTSVARRVRS